MLSPTSSLYASLCLVLDEWRQRGRQSALNIWSDVTKAQDFESDNPLVCELNSRLNKLPGPRLLIDGIWFSRSYGGITRVWEEILSTFSLDGFVSPAAPVAYLDRDTRLALCSNLQPVAAPVLDPLDYQALQASAPTNSQLTYAWRADVFVSSWITFCHRATPRVTQLALVHDCIPEHSLSPNADLLRVRSEWMAHCAGRLCVSRHTLSDVLSFYPRPNTTHLWCYPYPPLPEPCPTSYPLIQKWWAKTRLHASIRYPFVLLPGTSSIGSYKNPEVVARALSSKGLEDIQLVITGINSAQYATDLIQSYPSLQSRTVAFGATSLELVELYRHAFAILVPSRLEGFGLPVVEALNFNSHVLIADSAGLKEAGGCAALRFLPEDHNALASLLRLLRDPDSSKWLTPVLNRRSAERLQQLHPDLLGLYLASMARQTFSRNTSFYRNLV